MTAGRGTGAAEMPMKTAAADNAATAVRYIHGASSLSRRPQPQAPERNAGEVESNTMRARTLCATSAAALLLALSPVSPVTPAAGAQPAAHGAAHTSPALQNISSRG
ncbi:hypothetical protein ACFXGI_27765 [Streptomyces sp. NPDC059355]|uniref:hypothetical protein n=1 Tax=Streptomyces sp. NPDC059355 TaxID=3346811 RepID=UPI0036AFE51C